MSDLLETIVAPAPLAPRRLLTNSLLTAYRTCQRLYYYSYDQLYRPAIEAEPLHTGTLGHLGLEAWWLSAQRGEAPDERLTHALAAIAHEAERDPFEHARMAVLLTGYSERWGGENLEVVAVEVHFVAPIINPETGAASRTWELGGKIDAVVRRDGRLWIVEHKFSGEDTSPGSTYWQRLKVDAQVSTYHSGALALYGDLYGCIYDVIAKPTSRPLKATPAEARKYKKDGSLYATQREFDETPDQYAVRITELIIENPGKYYVRGEVVRFDEEIIDAQFDVWQTAKALRESELAQRWPRNPSACARYGRSCEFLPVCCREASLDDPQRYRRASATHEELVEINPTSSTPKELEGF